MLLLALHWVAWTLVCDVLVPIAFYVLLFLPVWILFIALDIVITAVSFLFCWRSCSRKKARGSDAVDEEGGVTSAPITNPIPERGVLLGRRWWRFCVLWDLFGWWFGLTILSTKGRRKQIEDIKHLKRNKTTAPVPVDQFVNVAIHDARMAHEHPGGGGGGGGDDKDAEDSAEDGEGESADDASMSIDHTSEVEDKPWFYTSRIHDLGENVIRGVQPHGIASVGHLLGFGMRSRGWFWNRYWDARDDLDGPVRADTVGDGASDRLARWKPGWFSLPQFTKDDRSIFSPRSVDQYFGDSTILTASNVVLRIPGIRVMARWFGVHSVSKASLMNLLNQSTPEPVRGENGSQTPPMGVRVTIEVGGMNEMIDTDHAQLTMAQPNAFLKLAFETKTLVEPVYVAGEHSLCWFFCRASWLKSINMWCRYTIGFPFLFLFWGPLRRKLTVVVGRQIDPAACEHLAIFIEEYWTEMGRAIAYYHNEKEKYDRHQDGLLAPLFGIGPRHEGDMPHPVQQAPLAEEEDDGEPSVVGQWIRKLWFPRNKDNDALAIAKGHDPLEALNRNPSRSNGGGIHILPAGSSDRLYDKLTRPEQRKQWWKNTWKSLWRSWLFPHETSDPVPRDSTIQGWIERAAQNPIRAHGHYVYGNRTLQQVNFF